VNAVSDQITLCVSALAIQERLIADLRVPVEASPAATGDCAGLIEFVLLGMNPIVHAISLLVVGL
jgi:hypothetical protein